MDVLAKGRHKFWATRHINGRKDGPSRKRQETEVIEEEVLSESEMSLAKNAFGVAQLTLGRRVNAHAGG